WIFGNSEHAGSLVLASGHEAIPGGGKGQGHDRSGVFPLRTREVARLKIPNPDYVARQREVAAIGANGQTAKLAGMGQAVKDFTLRKRPDFHFPCRPSQDHGATS